MPYKDKEKKAEWDARESKVVALRFMRSTDSDIITWLDKQDHPSTSIKAVLRKHVEEEGV